jgi:REP element-mobilizing transposase RayT
MENKFNNKYRVGSCRLKAWNYGSDGHYFITICTCKREPFFGTLESNGDIIYSITGDYVIQSIYTIPTFHPFVTLDKFVVMPDHLHLILIFAGLDNNAKNKGRFGPQSKNLASVMRGFKSSVTIFTSKHNIEFSWQAGFYDHIIRNENQLERIRNYIINNPIKHARLHYSNGNP